MGTGKSTIGKLLSKDLDLNFIDTDKQIEKHFNMPINNIFDQHGEPSFRKIESRVLQKVTESIVACGGGIVVKKENRDFIKLNGTSLLLNSKINLLEKRLKDSSNRPLLNDNVSLDVMSYDDNSTIALICCDNVSLNQYSNYNFVDNLSLFFDNNTHNRT